MYSRVKRSTINVFLIIMILVLTGCGSSGIKVPAGAKDYVGRNYDEVVSELRGLGFSVFEDTVVDDLTSTGSMRDGSIEMIAIDGNAAFSAEDSFDPKACVAIKYHIIKKLSSPLSAQEIENSDVESIISGYKNAGFTNVKSEEVYDLDPDTLQGDHINEVKISGNKVENTTDLYAFDADVKVVCHYPYQKFDLNIVVDFDRNLLFSKYGVDVLLDGQTLSSLNHGEDWNTHLRLKRGIYELRFCKSGDDTVSGITTVELSGNTDATYWIHCNSKKIDVKTTSFNQEQMPDINEVKLLCNSDAYRNRDHSEVEKELRDIGFEDVKAQEVNYDNGMPEGMTLGVTINGNEYFNEGEIYRKDAPVVVAYNKPEVKPADDYQDMVAVAPDIALEDIGKTNTEQSTAEKSVVVVPASEPVTEVNNPPERTVSEEADPSKTSKEKEAVVPEKTNTDSVAEKSVKETETTKSKSEVTEPVKKSSDEIVYITKTGEKYHRAGCKYLKKSKIETTKQAAINSGKEPCSVCKP